MECVITGKYSILDVPYFENDFWTNFMEENLKTDAPEDLHSNGVSSICSSGFIISYRPFKNRFILLIRQFRVKIRLYFSSYLLLRKVNGFRGVNDVRDYVLF